MTAPLRLQYRKRVARAGELYDAGGTVSDIAREMRCRVETARRLIKASGRTMRNPGRHCGQKPEAKVCQADIGRLPPEHPLADTVDATILRDRAALEALDRRRAQRRQMEAA